MEVGLRCLGFQVRFAVRGYLWVAFSCFLLACFGLFCFPVGGLDCCDCFGTVVVYLICELVCGFPRCEFWGGCVYLVSWVSSG